METGLYRSYMVASPTNPSVDLIYCNHYYGDPQIGTPNSGNPCSFS